MKKKTATKNKYPSASDVGFDYGYRMGVLSELRPPNKFICGYCRQQGLTENTVKHLDDCPQKPKGEKR